MKKFFLSVLSVLLILSFASCGPETDVEDPSAPVVEDQYDNDSILDAIDEARDFAIEADAENLAPSTLEALDEKYDELYERAEAEENIVKEGKDLADAYLALGTYLKALEAKELIEETGMQDTALDMYNQGCTALDELEEMYDEGNATPAQLLAKATTSKACFDAVLNTIYKKLSTQARQSALEAKKDADSVKAGVAMKSEYNEAVNTFKKGDSYYTRQQSYDAYKCYVEAADTFDELFDEVSEKREAAERAIEEAKQKVRESSDFAEAADEQAPITEAMNGIEDEDAVLLEEEEYDDPSEAEADLPETVQEPDTMDIGDAK